MTQYPITLVVSVTAVIVAPLHVPSVVLVVLVPLGLPVGVGVAGGGVVLAVVLPFALAKVAMVLLVLLIFVIHPLAPLFMPLCDFYLDLDQTIHTAHVNGRQGHPRTVSLGGNDIRSWEGA